MALGLGWVGPALAGNPNVAVNGSLADLVESARQSVVHVRAVVPDPGRSASGTNAILSVGSGFFVDSAGMLVTNEHVVRGAVDLRVRLFDGRELPACVVGLDRLTDLALLEIKVGTPVRELPRGDSDRVRVGETVFAIGSPFGFSHSVTAGIVSARDRIIERSEPHGESESNSSSSEGYAFFVQTDALINVGNSGGPLVDRQGNVIGMNTAFWGAAQTAQGVGFAIPINIVKLLLPRLRNEGEAPRSYLGVQSQNLDSNLANAFGVQVAPGALIAGVDTGSPAESGGIEPGDLVLVWDGHPLHGAEDFKIYAQLTPPGARVRLSVARGGKTTDHILTTRAVRSGQHRDTPPLFCRSLESPATLPDGFETADLPVGRAQKLPGGKGIRVSKVSGGAARDAGLEVDDIILRVGNSVVRDAQELRQALSGAPAGRPVPMLLRRDGADFWRALPPR